MQQLKHFLLILTNINVTYSYIVESQVTLQSGIINNSVTKRSVETMVTALNSR